MIAASPREFRCPCHTSSHRSAMQKPKIQNTRALCDITRVHLFLMCNVYGCQPIGSTFIELPFLFHTTLEVPYIRFNIVVDCILSLSISILPGVFRDCSLNKKIKMPSSSKTLGLFLESFLSQKGSLQYRFTFLCLHDQTTLPEKSTRGGSTSRELCAHHFPGLPASSTLNKPTKGKLNIKEIT